MRTIWEQYQLSRRTAPARRFRGGLQPKDDADGNAELSQTFLVGEVPASTLEPRA